MTDDQLMSGIWEAVARLLLPAFEKHGADDVIRSWGVGLGKSPVEVLKVREEFRDSVLATARAWRAPVRAAAAEVAAAVSQPVASEGPGAGERATGLMEWLGKEFEWAALSSEDSVVALRAAGQLRSVVDAVRWYGFGAQVDKLLRAHGVDPAAVS